MPERNCMSHISKNLFGKRFDQQSIKEGLEGALGNRDDDSKYYNKSEHKWNKYLKSLKNQNKMLFIISNKSSSHRKLNNINKIKAKASKKRSYSSSNSSSSDSVSYSSLSSDSD